MSDLKQILGNLRNIIPGTFKNYIAIFNKIAMNMSKCDREINSARKEFYNTAKEKAEDDGYVVKCVFNAR
jgi:hypothetical protein